MKIKLRVVPDGENFIVEGFDLKSRRDLPDDYVLDANLTKAYLEDISPTQIDRKEMFVIGMWHYPKSDGSVVREMGLKVIYPGLSMDEVMYHDMLDNLGLAARSLRDVNNTKEARFGGIRIKYTVNKTGKYFIIREFVVPVTSDLPKKELNGRKVKVYTNEYGDELNVFAYWGRNDGYSRKVFYRGLKSSLSNLEPILFAMKKTSEWLEERKKREVVETVI